MLAGAIILVSNPPFPVVVLSFALSGLGQAVNLALNNKFCANLANYATTLGVSSFSRYDLSSDNANLEFRSFFTDHTA